MTLRSSPFNGSRGMFAAAVPILLVALLLAGCAGHDGVPPGDAPHLSSAAPPAEPTAAVARSGLVRDGDSDLHDAQRSFARGAYGLAEKKFRAAIEQNRDDAEAWLGLAASYDRLARYDLADRAYIELDRLGVDKAIVLNNRGFSYILRGDHTKARKLLRRAQELRPGDERIARNLAVLEAEAAGLVTGSTMR